MRRTFLAALLVLAAAPLAGAACREDFACPADAGVVEVDLRFDGASDGRRDGALSGAEIQCAVDCLDGDRDADGALVPGEGGASVARVPSSVLRFHREIRHAIERPLELPLALGKPGAGRLLVEGGGAVLQVADSVRAADWPRGFAVLGKRAPPGANTCDIEVLASLAGAWEVEGLTLRGPSARLRDRSFLSGLAVEGSTNLVVRDCRFEGLGTGLELRFALESRIEECAFAGNAVQDILLGTRGPCRGGDCYAACTGQGPALFPRAVGNSSLLDGGCNATVIFGTRHVAAPGQRAAIVIANVQAALVEGAMFAGPASAPRIWRTGYDARTCTLRDLVVERASPAVPVVRDEGNGVLALERLAVLADDGGPALVYSALGPTRPRQPVLDDLSAWPRAWRVLYDAQPPAGTADWIHAWHFSGPRAAEARQAERWLRDDARPGGTAPVHLLVSAPSAVATRGDVRAREALVVPRTAPVDEAAGATWLDPTDGALHVRTAPGVTRTLETRP